MKKREFKGFIKDNSDTQFHFSARMACEYGVKESIILNNIQFWIITNMANGHNFYDGRTWIYNSVSAWIKIYPFFSAKEIRGALQRLVDSKVLRKNCYNKHKYDRTAWYSFENEFLWVEKSYITSRNDKEGYEMDPVTKGQMEEYEKANGW
jgi:hypothetical protein